MAEGIMSGDLEARRLPLWKHMVAGGIGGVCGDALLHGLDTVKTRQQAAPGVSKYATASSTFTAIVREEGIFRGLYSGFKPVIYLSLPCTMTFFGIYESSKRKLIANHFSPTSAYLLSGFFADLALSALYVPIEVIKTRMQLQGGPKNPNYTPDYNYKGTFHALKTIRKVEGTSALFKGYLATMCRDLPYSALEFAFYENCKKAIHKYTGSKHPGIQYEFLNGALSGAFAGFITTPLDVVKTKLQTQLDSFPSHTKPAPIPPSIKHLNPQLSRSICSYKHPGTSTRTISTSSPPTMTPTAVIATGVRLNSSSVFKGLYTIASKEGIGGLFRGVAPRVALSSTSGTILFVIYEQGLHFMGDDSM